MLLILTVLKRIKKKKDVIALQFSDFNITLSTDKSYEFFFENGKVEIHDTITVKEGVEECITHQVMTKVNVSNSFICS